MEITFLGTSSMLPTKERNHMSILLSYKTDNILIDCGEGTQKQLRIAGKSVARITKILISHWHGDHILGLPGLLSSMGIHSPNKTIELYGPKGSVNYFKHMLKWFAFLLRVNVKIKEVSNGIIFENPDFKIESITLDHDVPCLGYSFTEKDKRNIDVNYIKRFGLKSHPILKDLQNGKNIVWKGKKILVSKATKIKKGKKVTIILDTKYCNNAIKLAKNSDLLITESTWLSDLEDLTYARKHLTAKQAALIAKKAKVKKLILTHFSQRYKDEKVLEKDAKKVFKNTIASKDFMRITV